MGGLSSAAVVLAAGQASRFHGETHKLLTPFRGRPLLAWAVDAAVDAALDETIVVVGAVHVDVALPGGVSRVRNLGWQDGLASSLQTGIAAARAAGHDAVVVGLGDQPLVTAAAWRAVAAAEATVVVATYEGRQGHPVRLAADVWPLLPTTGDAGARRLMRERPDLVAEVACAGQPADVDTLEDLARWS